MRLSKRWIWGGFNAAQIEDHIRGEFPDTSREEIPSILADKRKKEFALFLEKSYPAERVKEILQLFADRSHDRQIKEMVSQEASVPTIYEYIVGIAWYYFSGKRIDLTIIQLIFGRPLRQFHYSPLWRGINLQITLSLCRFAAKNYVL